jgi:integrase
VSVYFRPRNVGLDVGRGKSAYAMIEKLNGKQIRNAKPGYHADGGGLYLQKRESGPGSWIFRYARNGKETWLGLGSLDTINVTEAREHARQMRQMLLAGNDPAIERRELRAERAKQQAATILFRDAWAEVVAARKGEWKHSESLRQWEFSLASIDRTLGGVPCHLIDANMIRSALESEWKRTQVTAERTRQRIEAVLDWAAVRTGRAGVPNPARWKGNLQHVLRDTAKVKHHEALPYNQLPEFMGQLRARNTPAARALEFAVLTAARSAEALGARWSEIDGDTWSIPAERMKEGKAHVVPLSPRAVEIINAIPRNSDWVFTSGDGRRAGKPIGRDAFKDTLKALAVDATAHGFRSTFSDWAADNTAYPQEVREQALAHAIPNKVEAAYRRGALLEKRRRLMAEWARFCASTAAARDDKVVAIRSGS